MSLLTASQKNMAALDVWAAGPAGRVATAEQLTAVGASVRLPLVPGPLLAAAAVLMPETAFAEWPLEPLQRYYGCELGGASRWRAHAPAGGPCADPTTALGKTDAIAAMENDSTTRRHPKKPAVSFSTCPIMHSQGVP